MKPSAALLAAGLLLAAAALSTGQAVERGAAGAPAAELTGRGTVYTATLSGQNGVPPLNSPASGTFSMRCSENPGNHALDECSWTLDVSGIQDVTMAHIHRGGPTENGDVIVWLVPELKTAPADNSLPTLNPPVSGTQQFKGAFRDAGIGGPLAGSTIDQVKDMFASGLQAYINVHTTANPAGEIRGQLRQER